MFPAYHWDRNFELTETWSIKDIPESISTNSTELLKVWPFKRDHLFALHAYLHGLRWAPGGSTSFCEIVVDFEASLGMRICTSSKCGFAEASTISAKTRVFVSMLKALSKILKSPVLPGKMCMVDAMKPFHWGKRFGIEGLLVFRAKDVFTLSFETLIQTWIEVGGKHNRDPGRLKPILLDCAPCLTVDISA